MKNFHTVIDQSFKPLRRTQALALLLFLATVFLKLMLLVKIQRAIDSIPAGKLSVTMEYLKEGALLIAAFCLINGAMQYFYRRLEYTSHYFLIKTLFGRALEKGCAFHDTFPPPVLLSMIKDDSRFLSDWKSIGVITVYGNLITLAAAFGLLLSYHPAIACLTLAVITVCFVLTSSISRKIGEKTYDLQVSNSRMNEKIMDYLGGIKDIKQYGKKTFFQRRLTEFVDGAPYQQSKSISKYYAVFTSIYGILTNALPILTVLTGTLLILKGQYTVGELIAAYALVGAMQEPVLTIPDFFNQRKQALAMQEKLMPILAEEAEQCQERDMGKLKSFEYRSDQFKFQDGKTILKDIAFRLEGQGYLVIKGESGRGKTSLLNLISRFQDFEGQPVNMAYNGIPIETIPRKEYYSLVIQARQTPYLFKATLLENITLGDEYSREELEEALHTACLEEFVREKGLEVLIEENGENISGGQKQRIGIARAILRKPDILMLDEPVSALNQELAEKVAERLIQYAAKNRMTLILVSHNDSFERRFEKDGSLNVKKINV